MTQFEDEPPTNDEQPTLDPLAEIRRYEPPGDRDDRAGYCVPHHISQALDAVVAQLMPWRTNASLVTVWALARGLRRLRELSDVQAICRAREDLLRRGCDTTMLEWSYAVATHGRRTKRLNARRVDRSDIGHCRELAAGLGLELSAVASVAICAALIDVPLRGDIPRLIETDLRDWFDALQRRAAFVRDLHARAVASSTQPLRHTPWADIVRGERS
jgi:hypothetical protein